MTELLFATHNPNKVKEVSSILGSSWSIIRPQDIGFTEDIEETGDDLKANALIKTQAYEQVYSGHIFSEDTGLEVEALNGAPGVRTARYAGEQATASDNMDKLLKALKDEDNRKARFRTVICLKLNGEYHFFEGLCDGYIARHKAGRDGFGYDPVFVPEGYQQSFAELGDPIKKELSHRAKAMNAMIRFLQSQP